MHEHDKEEIGSRIMAAREMTVGELLERRIEKAERQAAALRTLRDSMAQGFLRSGASNISALLEL